MPTIAINSITSQVPNVGFTISGTLTGYSTVPVLFYRDDSGAFQALPANQPTTPVVVATNLNVPWGIGFLPDGSMLVSQRDQFSIRHISASGATLGTISVPNTVSTNGEGGLMGIAVDPGFTGTSGFIYLSHTISYNGGFTPNGNEVIRYTFNASANTISGGASLLTYDAGQFHNGGGVGFGPDGKLYISCGNGTNPGSGSSAGAQLRTNATNGKILRINSDGSIPSDNPFGNAVWTIGHRNPQGFGWQGTTMWGTEQGPTGESFGTFSGINGNDKINLLTKGTNYGFPLVYGPNTTTDQYGNVTTPPALTSGDNQTWAPVGIIFNGGSIFFGALGGISNTPGTPAVDQCTVSGTSLSAVTNRFGGTFGRIRAMAINPADGLLYFSTSNTDGRSQTSAFPTSTDDHIYKVGLAQFTGGGGNANVTTTTFSFPHPGMTQGSHTISVEDSNSTTVNSTSNTFAVGSIPPTISISNIPAQQTNTAFPVSGVLSNYASAPGLTFADDTAALGPLPAGNSVSSTSFNFNNPGLPAGNHSVKVQDTNGVNSISNTFVVSAGSPPPPPPPSPNQSPDNTVINGTVGTIVDSKGQTWAINSSAFPTVNGTADTTFPNIVTLAWEKGVIWSEDNTGIWWANTSLVPGSWGPPTTVSPIPGTVQIKHPGGAIDGIGVQELLYWNHTVNYKSSQANSAGGPPGWYSWNGSGWNPIPGDPSLGTTESAQGTMLTNATGAVTDASGGSWRLVGTTTFQVSHNGVVDGSTSNVVLLLYWNHQVYYENSGNNWFVWNGSGWIATSDPRNTANTESPNNTTLTGTTGTIVDGSLNVFALFQSASNGLEVSLNNVVDATTTNTIMALYFNHQVYRQSSNANVLGISPGWWFWSGTAWVAVNGDPRITAVTWNANDKSSGIALSNGGLTAKSSFGSPNPPTNVTTANITQTAVTVNWTAATTATAVSQSVRSSTGYSSGKFYHEFIGNNLTNDFAVGLATSAYNLGATGSGGALPGDATGVQAFRVADMLERFGVNTFSSLSATSNVWGTAPSDYSPTTVINAINWLTNGNYSMGIREYHYQGRELSTSAGQATWCPQVSGGTTIQTPIIMCTGSSGDNGAIPSLIKLAQSSASGIKWMEYIEGINEPNINSLGTTTNPYTSLIPFSNNSVFNLPLGDGAQWQVNTQLQQQTNAVFNTVDTQASSNIYVSSASDPVFTVSNAVTSQGNTIAPFTLHIPSGANVTTNGNINFMDQTTGKLYCFFQFTYTGSNTVSVGNTEIVNILGSGIDGNAPNSDFDGYVCTITSADIAAGQINHMIRVTMPDTALKSASPTDFHVVVPYCWPQDMEDSNGPTAYTGQIPFGITFGIPANVVEPANVAANAGAHMLWTCLQTHGCMIRDANGTFPMAFSCDQNIPHTNALLTGAASLMGSIIPSCQILINQGPNSINGGGNPLVTLNAPTAGTTYQSVVVAAQQELFGPGSGLAGVKGVVGPSIVISLPNAQNSVTGYFSASDLTTIAANSGFLSLHAYLPTLPSLDDGTAHSGFLGDCAVGYRLGFGQPNAGILITEWHPTLFNATPSLQLNPTYDAYYAPIYFFEAFRFGYLKWYWFALFDFGTITLSGLFPQNFSNPRPVAFAIKAMYVLAGLGGPTKRTFSPTKLNYTVTNGQPVISSTGTFTGCQTMLFQHDNGTFHMALWNAQVDPGGTAQNVTVNFLGGNVVSVSDYNIGTGSATNTTAVQTLNNVSSITVSLNAAVHWLVIQHAGATGGSTSGLGNDANSIAFHPVAVPQSIVSNGVTATSGTTADVNGDVIGVASDLTNHLLWVTTPVMRAAGKPWNNSATANPATGTGGVSFNIGSGPYFATFNDDIGGAIATANFGASNFSQVVPAGFQAWSSGGQVNISNAPTFSDDFGTLSLYNSRSPSSGGNWEPASWSALDGFSTSGQSSWSLNPFNPATPISTVYQASGGVFTMEVLATPSNLLSAAGNQAFLSGYMSTQPTFRQAFGYFETRIAVPKVQGTSFVFSLRTDQGFPPEIDIAQIISLEGTNNTWFARVNVWDTGTVSVPPANTWNTNQTGSPLLNLDVTQFHTFGVNWQASTMTFYYDRIQVFQMATPAGYSVPMFPILATYAGAAGSGSGAIVNTTLLPIFMQVDYVKVWKQRPF